MSVNYLVPYLCLFSLINSRQTSVPAVNARAARFTAVNLHSIIRRPKIWIDPIHPLYKIWVTQEEVVTGTCWVVACSIWLDQFSKTPLDGV